MPIKIQLDWMPMYVQKLKASAKYRGMEDFQQAWYLNLLFEAWDSDNPGYLPDDNNLWQLANARSERFFAEKKAAVLACFESTQLYGRRWIFNRRLLAVMAEHPAYLAMNSTPRATVAANRPDEKSTDAQSFPHNFDVCVSLLDSSELLKAVLRIFEYYCKVFNRNKNQYSLTKKREAKCAARLHERMKINAGSLAAAEAEARLAIDNLAATPWNRGENPSGKKYIDWLDHLFGSAEEFEKRLVDVRGKPNHGAEPISNAAKRERRIIDATRAAFDALATGPRGNAVGVRGDDPGRNRSVGSSSVEVPRGRGNRGNY